MNLPDLLTQYKAPLVAISLIVLLAAGLIWPFSPRLARDGVKGGVRGAVRGGWGRLGKNLGLAGLNALLSLAVIVPITVLASQMNGASGGPTGGFFTLSGGLDWRPAWWMAAPMGPLALALDLLILDVWIYTWHRANHKFAWLWRFHQVHHLDETLDASTALRFHFGEVLNASLVRAVVIVLLVVPLRSVLVFEVLVALSAIFHHSNLRLPPAFERVLAWFIVTPSIHWVHHHARRADTDSNYATVLSVWDRIFRTRSQTARTPGMPMGVEGARDVSLATLIALPFRGVGASLVAQRRATDQGEPTAPC